MNKGSNKRLTTEEFIMMAKKIHGELYDYSPTNYKRSLDKVEIICKKHGSFWCTPNNHLSKKTGCNKCGFERMGEFNKNRVHRKYTLEERKKCSEMAKMLGFGKWMKGRKMTQYNKEKLNEANKNKIFSEDTKLRMSESKKGEKNGCYGKIYTKEEKQRISRTSKEKWKNPEFRKKMLSLPGKHDWCSKGGLAAAKSLNRFYGTKPEREMEAILIELQVPFEKQITIWNIPHKCSVDFVLPKSRTVIEVDGKYWHNYPVGREIDHIRTHEMRTIGYKVLRFWENEFNRDMVKEAIS